MIRKRDVVKDVVKNIGLLDDNKIERALEEQVRTKERLANVMVSLGYISNHAVGKTLVSQIGILPQAVDVGHLDKDISGLLPGYLAVSHRIIPLRKEPGVLILGTDDPLNFLAERYFESVLGMPVELELVRAADMDKALNALYLPEQKGDIEVAKIYEDVHKTRSDEDAPIIKLVNVIIDEAVKRRASDIHLEPLEDRFRVRYRIDGVLHEVKGPPKRLQGSVISRLKIMAGMDIAEKRLPQDGRINIKLNQKELDLRVSTLPAIHGESVVMRILDKSGFLVGIDDVGFLPDHRKAFEKLIGLPHGMILITGPTGSGKTTTLYATLSHINQKERKVITIEDPVEYQLDGINQVQVKPQIGLTFASGLRSMLRQAPDIIMVGEIRDLETAEIAIQSALTGHLIFSTLHTNNAPSAVTRLIDMGIKPYLVATTVQGVVAQRLVRTICPSCRVAYRPSEEEIEVLFSGSEKSGRTSDFELYKGSGCSACNQTGYKGRMGIFEVLTVTDEIRDMILNQVSDSEICRAAVQLGFRTLRYDGLEKVKRGYTTIQEVMRVTQDV